MDALGRHIIVEFYGCTSARLNDVIHIEQGMLNAATEAGATVINSTFHHFSPFGVSGVVVIQESHLAIHTWPEYQFASVDLFTCGDIVDPWVSFDLMKEVLEATHYSAMEMQRGSLHLLEKAGETPSELQPLADMQPKVKSSRDVWFTEREQNTAFSVRHTGDLLYRKNSPFQKVEVYQTFEFGNMLVLDGCIMCTEKDEYAYHEMIAHVPVLTHPNPKRALIIGGGDGGVARELLRHEQLEQVVMVEIDALVIEASKAHLPSISAALEHPQLDLRIEDGIKYVQNAKDAAFDVVIVDSTDPIGPAAGLFNEAFYRQVYRILSENGILVVQSESPRYNQRIFREIFDCHRQIFGRDQVYCYLAYIPTYPTGMWSFSYASKGSAHPLTGLDDEHANAFATTHQLQYYNAGVHRGAFALPTFVSNMLGDNQ
ncbi:MAG: polyamine aminopropyltransferase [Gemmatimonadetes bacterium]|nr:MAG: polyamine aminopropyltransferase [Gemmatimonadota bacterium]